MFSIPFYQQVTFTDGKRSLDWGISSLLIILGKFAGKLPRLSRLTISSFTIETISFPAAQYFRFFGGNIIKSGENSSVGTETRYHFLVHGDQPQWRSCGTQGDKDF